ncbi:class I SAM-dependent methyltransferase [Bacillus kwashiorkori]|uniref:class I SAM-dependent methyltransferase n=1 Tax=Bacillus kwashiorkori TaxID=1522318 RepID=UPI000780BF7A|nr:class I SAM-dependent methyltransferase [Bacillus kwashiorkori]
MTEHYYSQKVTTASNPQTWNYSLRGMTFKFTTDHGVFSKNEVDFGSRFLIETFSEPEIAGPFLDVGCGYGPIGLSIAKSFPNRFIHMVDVNERAIFLAEKNATNNRITNVTIYESNSFANVTETNFAAILTNPPIRAGKKVVFDILEKSFSHLLEGGELWVVIQKKQGAPSTKVKLEELFTVVETVDKNKGYYIFRSKK